MVFFHRTSLLIFNMWFHVSDVIGAVIVGHFNEVVFVTSHEVDPSYQRHITFACTGCYPLTPSPSRYYYSRLIDGTNLPTSKGWLAWWDRTKCIHITFARGYYTVESTGTRRKWTQVVGPKTNLIVQKMNPCCPISTRHQRTNCTVYKGPIN